MTVKVRFVNESGEKVTLYRQDGSVLKVLEEGKRWNRDPKLGTLSTVSVDEAHGQKFPPPRPGPKWIDKTEWTWNECPDDSIYAPFRTITFLDNNVVKLKRRPFWKAPQMEWPCVLFLFKSHKMKMIRERLDKDISSFPETFYNGIPVRLTVSPISKYAPYRKWIFDEVMELKDANPPYKTMVETYEMTEHGEDERPAAELEKIAELKAKDEERKKLGLV